MKKLKMNLLLLFSAIFLVACGQEQNVDPSSSETKEPETEQVETTEDSTDEEQEENQEETETETEETKEEVQAQVIERIMDHLEKTENVDREHVMVLISEQDDYEDYEARENSPEDPNVTHLLGMYRYYPEEDKLEVYNSNSDTYETIK